MTDNGCDFDAAAAAGRDPLAMSVGLGPDDIRIAADVGGTFTDIAFLTPEGLFATIVPARATVPLVFRMPPPALGPGGLFPVMVEFSLKVQ